MELSLQQEKDFREYLQKRFSLPLSPDYEIYTDELLFFIERHYSKFIMEAMLVAHQLFQDTREARTNTIELLYNSILWDYLEESVNHED